MNAHSAVARAIEHGELTRGPCEVCGATENIQAHHDDYDFPLEVRWLCRSHHMKWHALNGPGANRPEIVSPSGSGYVTIRLRNDFRAILEQYAEFDDRSISWEIRYAIERYIAEREAALAEEIAEDEPVRTPD